MKIFKNVAFFLLAFFLGVCVQYAYENKSNYYPDVYKVMIGNGHGSGFHIGDGTFVTAEHVVHGQLEVELKSIDGRIYKGIVFHTIPEKDLAFIKTVEVPISKTEVSCNSLKVGEEIWAFGNPLGNEFIKTFGHVGGLDRSNKTWENIFLADITAAQGMSGGPVFNKFNQVIGVVVGAPLQNIRGSSAFVGLTYIVPSKEICKTLDIK